MKQLFENWRKHITEAAVPHSAHHVVKKMKKTGLSAKEALKSLTTDLSDEEAERWLERHKDEMDSAKKELNEAEDEQSDQWAVDKVKEVVTLFSRLYNSLPDDASKEIFENYLNKNVELYTKEWQKERAAEESEIDDDNIEIEF